MSKRRRPKTRQSKETAIRRAVQRLLSTEATVKSERGKGAWLEEMKRVLLRLYKKNFLSGLMAPIRPAASRPRIAGGQKGAPIKPPVQRPATKPATSQPVKK